MIWWFFFLFLLIPIFVHLFDFRRAKKLYFSAVQHITLLSKKAKAKSKLRYIFILSCRFLSFGCLLFALSQLLSDSDSSERDETSAFHIDNSLSLTLNDGSILVKELLNDVFDELNTDFSSNSSFTNKSYRKFYSNSAEEAIRNVSSLSNLNNVIISDFQSSSLSEIKNLLVDSSKNYQLILLNSLSGVRNVSIDSLWFQTNANNSSQLSINIRLRKHNFQSGSIVLKLRQGENQLSSVVKGIENLDIIKFDIPIIGYGQYTVEMQGDEVGYDDMFHFVLEERSKPIISILNNETSYQIGRVFENSNLFDAEVLNINNLDYDRLSDSDLIVFDSFEELPRDLIDQFSEKSLLIFPGDSADLKSYQNLGGLNFSKADQVRVEIVLDPENELLKGIFEKNVKPGSMPKFSKVFSIDGGFEPIIKYRDGHVFFLSTGSIWLFNTRLGHTSGFGSNALFLPLLYQIAFTSAGTTQEPYFYPGDTFVEDISVSETPMKIIGEDVERIPEFNSAGSMTAIQLPDDLKAGFYYLVNGVDTLRQLAINVPKSESVMQAPSIDDLNDAFEGYENVSVTQMDLRAGNVLYSQSPETHLWKYALILALLFILSETMLHRYLR